MRRLLAVLYRSIPVKIIPHELHPEGFHTVSKSPSKAFLYVSESSPNTPVGNSGVVTRRFPELPFKVTEEEVASSTFCALTSPRCNSKGILTTLSVCGGKMAIFVLPPSNILMAL